MIERIFIEGLLCDQIPSSRKLRLVRRAARVMTGRLTTPFYLRMHLSTSNVSAWPSLPHVMIGQGVEQAASGSVTQ